MEKVWLSSASNYRLLYTSGCKNLKTHWNPTFIHNSLEDPIDYMFGRNPAFVCKCMHRYWPASQECIWGKHSQRGLYLPILVLSKSLYFRCACSSDHSHEYWSWCNWETIGCSRSSQIIILNWFIRKHNSVFVCVGKKGTCCCLELLTRLEAVHMKN